MSFGFSLLAFEAYRTNSTIFLVKQLLVLVPVLVTSFLIITHNKDEWHDDKDKNCKNCKNELESHWKYCADCGESIYIQIKDL